MSNIKDYLVTVRTTDDASPTATLVMLGNDVLFKLDNNDPIPVSGETVNSDVLDYTEYERAENFVGESPLLPPPPPISASSSTSESLLQRPTSASRLQRSNSASRLQSQRPISESRSGSKVPVARANSPFRTGMSNNTRTGGRVNKTGKKVKRKPRTKTLKR